MNVEDIFWVPFVWFVKFLVPNKYSQEYQYSGLVAPLLIPKQNRASLLGAQDGGMHYFLGLHQFSFGR